MWNNLACDQEPRRRISGALARLASKTKMAIADARQRYALRRELADCAMNSDFDIILAEAGLGRGEIEPLIKGHPNATRLLRAMSERLGVEGERSKDPVILREMQRTCSLCAEHRRCRRWLHAHRKDGYHDFCPNAELLDLLRERAAAKGEIAG